MNLKETAINDAKNLFESGNSNIYPLKFLLWLKHCEENLMKLSQSNYENFKETIPLIIEIIISDFKKHYGLIPKESEEFKSFVRTSYEWFDSNKRMNVFLTIPDYDLIMTSLKKEYEKFFSYDKELLNFSSQKASKKEGCYIATMTYGDYNHPNVIIFRNFRDLKLRKNKIGVFFIKQYYNYSPKLVKILQNKKLINKFIKKNLDILALILKK